MNALTREQVEQKLNDAIEGKPGCISARDAILDHDAALRAMMEQLQNDFSDALDIKVCKGPTVLTDMKQQIYILTAQLATAQQAAIHAQDIAYIANNKWNEIQQQLLMAQQTIDAHDGIKTRLEVKIQELASELATLRQSTPRSGCPFAPGGTEGA